MSKGNVFQMCCSSKNDMREQYEPEGQTLLPVEPPKPVQREEPSSPAMQCLKICGGITVVLLALLLLLVLRVWTAECAIESFDHHYILPENARKDNVPEPFDRGIQSRKGTDGPAPNMDLSELDVDLAGVWWMDGNPLTAEHLVSFASAEGRKPFPAEVPVYNNLARRWTWTDDIAGRFVMAYYAFDAEPESALVFNFTNSSSATIVPVGGVFDGFFGFHKINNSAWDRPDANYVLRRIVDGDGSEGPAWQDFITWYDGIEPEGKVIVWSSDSSCLRRCQYFLPCFMCNLFC